MSAENCILHRAGHMQQHVSLVILAPFFASSKAVLITPPPDVRLSRARSRPGKKGDSHRARTQEDAVANAIRVRKPHLGGGRTQRRVVPKPGEAETGRTTPPGIPVRSRQIAVRDDTGPRLKSNRQLRVFTATSSNTGGAKGIVVVYFTLIFSKGKKSSPDALVRPFKARG
ncbi:hypothetical protein LX32DRAFT_264690 [Colletotrichum zoysiae]|uniref:Uncharacterized protein n=1 Tax=Colletotrichum zoysiae TaxID=1216348 RepID=A0AAD9LWV0_9PEZI|nr:hypothetical protein LX32DRAFT_264690 [Colletotrichum zoysiae]